MRTNSIISAGMICRCWWWIVVLALTGTTTTIIPVQVCHAMENGGPASAGIHHLKLISSDDERSEIQPVSSSSEPTEQISYTLDGPPGSSYLSVHFTKFNFGPYCKMQITNSQGVEVVTMEGLGRHELGDKDGGFWAHHVEDDTMVLTVICSAGIMPLTKKMEKKNTNNHMHDGEKEDQNFVFEIDEFVAGYPNLLTRNDETYEEPVVRRRSRRRRLNHHPITSTTNDERNLGICDQDDKLDAKCYINKYPEEYKKSKPVARLLIGGSGVCTGFLVGNKGHLLTTNKCVKNDNQAKQVDVQFMYESTACQGFKVPLVKTYDVEKLVVHSAQNDYSLLLLKGVPHATVG